MLRSTPLSVLLWLLLCGGIAQAQVTATIAGTIADETGALLPGASVTATNVDTGMVRTALTGEQGRYFVPNLPSGGYELRAEISGFQTVVRRGIHLAVGGSAIVDLTLRIGGIAQEVVVTGEAPLMNLSRADTAGLVSSHEIRDLPINGRDFTELAGLQAGVTLMRNANDANTSKGYGSKMAFAGVRPSQTQVLIDGGDVNTLLNFRTPASASNVQLGVESVKEFQVLVGNYGAQIGGYGGGVINAITQSGTNKLFGSAYWFRRNDGLNASNFFDQAGGKPDFERNQFGVSLGGPIIPNKTFFFGNYEGLREQLGLTAIGRVPSAAMRAGNIAGRTVPVSAEIVPYLNLWPLPNGRDFGDGTAEFLWSSNRPTVENYALGRVDHVLSDSDRLTARYTGTHAEVVQSRLIPTFTDLRETQSHYVLLEYQRILSPRLLNTFRFHLNRSDFALDIGELTSIPQELYQFPGRPFSTLNIPGLSDPGPDNGSPRIEKMTLFEFADDLVYTRGNHNLKVGFLAKRYHYFKDSPFRSGGDFGFDSSEAFLQARPSTVGFQSLNSDSVRNMRQSLFGLYVQDDFRASRNLTLNLGVRWEFTTVPTETDGKLSNLINPKEDAEFFVGDPYYENSSLKNIAPRVGFAWDPFGTGRAAIRGAIGWYFDPYLLNYVSTPMGRTPPFFERTELRNPPTMRIVDALQRIQPSDIELAPATATYFPGSPYNLHYNLTLQRALAGNVSVTLAYVGSRGLNLPYNEMPNTAVPSGTVDGRKFFAAGIPRPNPHYGAILTNATGASSLYHSGQARLEWRPSGAFGFNASYTLAKTMDDVSGGAGLTDFDFSGRASPQDPYDISADWSLSAYDVRHAAIFRGTYVLPTGKSNQAVARALLNGWQVTAILQLASGSPVTPIITTTSYARNGSQGSQTRPDLREGADNNPVLGGPDRYYDVGAFVLQPRGFFGNLGRNTVIGPGLITCDIGVEKFFSVKGDVRVSLRAEVFNLLDRPNFGQPSTGAFDVRGPLGSAGRITRTVTSARQMQLAMRVTF